MIKIKSQEEIEKNNWLQSNQDKSENLFELEDHKLLQGQISIVGLENPELFPKFKSLFACEWDLIDCALMSVGLYMQYEEGWRYQLGSGSLRNINAWRSIFHKKKSNINGGYFDNTKKILCSLLSQTDIFSNEFLQNIIQDYITLCESKSEYPMQYYYIKYPHFRPGSYGKYTWEDLANKPYEMAVLLTQRNWSEYTYQPFLKTVDDIHLSQNIAEPAYCDNTSFHRNYNLLDD